MLSCIYIYIYTRIDVDMQVLRSAQPVSGQILYNVYNKYYNYYKYYIYIYI